MGAKIHRIRDTVVKRQKRQSEVERLAGSDDDRSSSSSDLSQDLEDVDEEEEGIILTFLYIHLYPFRHDRHRDLNSGSHLFMNSFSPQKHRPAMFVLLMPFYITHELFLLYYYRPGGPAREAQCAAAVQGGRKFDHGCPIHSPSTYLRRLGIHCNKLK